MSIHKWSTQRLSPNSSSICRPVPISEIALALDLSGLELWKTPYAMLIKRLPAWVLGPNLLWEDSCYLDPRLCETVSKLSPVRDWLTEPHAEASEEVVQRGLTLTRAPQKTGREVVGSWQGNRVRYGPATDASRFGRGSGIA
jgi:hypothetical protein